MSPLTIREAEPGLVRIGTDEFRHDVALTADGNVIDFSLPAMDSLTEKRLGELLQAEPEMLIIGTGWKSMLPPRELVFAMARRGVGIEVMDTPAACRTFNILVGEGRRPAAIIKIS